MKAKKDVCTSKKKLCVDSMSQWCGVPSGEFGCALVCSRPKGHTGQHIACGLTHNKYAWGGYIPNRFETTAWAIVEPTKPGSAEFRIIMLHGTLGVYELRRQARKDCDPYTGEKVVKLKISYEV